MSKAVKESTTKSVMGLKEYLRKHPQNVVIARLMKLYLGTKVMTESEWDSSLQEILNKKITH